MRDFKTLFVWQKAHQLTLDIYEITKTFPKDELYGLISQMRRSSASIPTNIAEGCGRNSDAELARFSIIAMGSASELEYQLLLAHDLQYLRSDEFEKLNSVLVEVKKMLNSFIRRLQSG